MPLRHESPYGAPTYGNGTTPPTAVCASGAAVPASAATMTALKAVTDLGDLTHGNRVMVDADGSEWYWHATSALTGDDILVATPAAAPAAGRWLRCPGDCVLELPIAYTTADGATLLTVPAGAAFKLLGAHWRITTGFSGGSSSAIGIASSVSGTAGDLLGGAGGELTAAIGTAGRKAGTIGPLMDTLTEVQTQLYLAAATVTFERIASVYTAGAGFACLEVRLLANAGA